MGSRSHWVRRLKPILFVSLGVCVVWAALVVASLHTFGRGVLGALKRVSANSMRAPVGSPAMLGNDTIGTIVEIAGVRFERDSADGRYVADSLMLMRAVKRQGSPPFDPSALVGTVPPILDWTAPLAVRLMPKNPALSARPLFGRLVFDSPRIVIPVVVVEP